MSAIIIASEAKKKAVRVLTRPEHLSMLYSTWPSLARELDVDEVNIKTLRDRIIVGTCYLPDAVSAVIEDWVSKTGSKATLSILLNGLERLDHKYIGEMLKDEFGIGKIISGDDAANEILFNNTLPDNIPYYISRTLISRCILDSEQLFEGAASVKDVFCFTGIERYELTNYVKNSVTDNSFTQIQRQQLSTRFIILDSDTHFTKICSKTNEPVHWLKFSQNYENTSPKTLKWVKSTGNIKIIQRSLNWNSKCQKKLTEAQLLQIAKKNRSPVCFSDCPGMGKSILLINIGHKIKELCPDRTVVHFDLRSFVQKLKDCRSSDIKLGIEKILLQTLCTADSSKATEQLNEIFYLDSVKIELLLDGFDEIFPDDVDYCLQIIKNTITLKYLRIWIASRPHFLEIIENALNVLGYNILPFTEGNQKEFLSSYWLSQNKLLSKIKLTKLAEKTLEIISSQTKDQDFAGIPLRCYLIAQVFEEKAMDFCTVESEPQELPELVTISSTFDLFTKMIEFKCRKYYRTYGITKYGKDALNRMLMKLAMDLIFPGELRNLNPELESVDVSVSDLINTGLLLRQGTEDLNGAKFVHQTIAEYFCAKFVLNLVDQYEKEEEWTEERKEFFFQEVLQLDSNGSFASFRNSTWDSFITVYCVELFCEDEITSDNDLAWEHGADRIEFTCHKFNKCNIPFAHPVVCYFLNSFLQKEEDTAIHGINFVWAIVYLKEIIWMCVRNNFVNIFKLLCCESLRNNCREMFDRDFLFVLLHYGQLDLVKEGFPYFEKFHKLDLELKCYILNHVGAVGNYPVFEYFCKEKNLNEFLLGEQSDYILVTIIKSSPKDSGKVLNQKMQIIRYILSVNISLIKALTYETLRNCHSDILCCLIEQGLDLEVQVDSFGNTLLHNYYFGTETDLYNIVCLIPLDKFKRLVQIQNKKGKTILHIIMQYSNVSLRILEKFKTANADFNSCDKSKSNLLMTAIKYRRSVEIVNYLLKEGANPNHVNRKGVSVLFFWQALWKDMFVLEELVKAGCDVFRQEDGYTFLHALLTNAYYPLRPSEFHAIVQILIASGKEKLLETKSEKRPHLTPLQLAIKKIKMHENTVTLLESVETFNFEKLLEEEVPDDTSSEESGTDDSSLDASSMDDEGWEISSSMEVVINYILIP